MLSISGFEEWANMINKIEKTGIDEAAKKTFNEMTGELSSTLREKSKDAGLSNHLLNGLSEYKVANGNRYFYNIGWRRKDSETFLKVCWLNYGTPNRYTNAGAFRGKVQPRYFITNTKRAVKRKFNAKMKRMQKEILTELSR